MTHDMLHVDWLDTGCYMLGGAWAACMGLLDLVDLGHRCTVTVWGMVGVMVSMLVAWAWAC